MAGTPATITIAAPPTTQETALTMLQWLFSETGQLTDYNKGSIVRTYAEAVGSIQEVEGVSSQSLAFQALVYSAYTAFGIIPLAATPSLGQVTFFTLSGQPIPPGLSILIPNGSIVQAFTGPQFYVTSDTILVSGASSVVANVQSVQAGSATNVVSGVITSVASTLSYPLGVINYVATAGGSDEELASQTLARFTAYVQSLGLASPIAIAGAVIGVTYNQEVVRYSTVYENWISQVQLGLTPTTGFAVYIDNGTGQATGNLISTVYNYLSNGGVAGFRPAGVPYAVYAVSGIPASANITVTSSNPALNTSIATAIQEAVYVYFASLGFGETAELTQLIAGVANVTFGQISSLSVNLLDYAGTPQSTVPPSLSAVTTGSITLPSATINVNDTTGFPPAPFGGQIILRVHPLVASLGDAVINYTGITATSFTGCTTISTATFTGGSTVISPPMGPTERVIGPPVYGLSITVN